MTEHIKCKKFQKSWNDFVLSPPAFVKNYKIERQIRENENLRRIHINYIDNKEKTKWTETELAKD